MTVALSLHTLATIIWLGGLFFLCVVFQLAAQHYETAMALTLWHRVVSRFFVWAWISLVVILVSGVAMVFLKFGGFSGVPSIHRVNMAIGIPAILLYVYLYFIPWRRFRRAMLSGQWRVAKDNNRQARIIMTLILALGIIASVVSLGGRYYG